MGGSAFTLDGLQTPRLPPHSYDTLAALIAARLKQQSAIFADIRLPISAPEKLSHGDIDLLALVSDGHQPPTLQETQSVLKAEKALSTTVESTQNFALVWPPVTYVEYLEWGQGLLQSDLPSSVIEKHLNRSILSQIESTVDVCGYRLCHDGTLGQHVRDASNRIVSEFSGLKLHFQLDLFATTSPILHEFRAFHHAHGDLVNILAIIIRRSPYHLVLTDSALQITIPELMKINKKLSRVQVTQNPNQILAYLGLDSGRFWEPFSTLDEMMDYIATCRFHDAAHYATKYERTENPRTNHCFRPTIMYWYDTYLPAHSDSQAGTASRLTREEFLADFFSFFGSDLQATYEAHRSRNLIMLGQETLWSNIRKHLEQQYPNSTDAHSALRSLKHEILSPAAPEKNELASVQQKYLDNDFEGVLAYAHANSSTAAQRWRDLISARQSQTFDAQKKQPFSTSPAEHYTKEDDQMICRMKADGKGWSEILAATGKTSKSQLVAHWKKDLNEATSGLDVKTVEATT